MAKGKSGSETASVHPKETAQKVERTPCGIQFETDEERKGHMDRHSCCNYAMYSSYYRRRTT